MPKSWPERVTAQEAKELIAEARMEKDIEREAARQQAANLVSYKQQLAEQDRRLFAEAEEHRKHQAEKERGLRELYYKPLNQDEYEAMKKAKDWVIRADRPIMQPTGLPSEVALRLMAAQVRVEELERRLAQHEREMVQAPMLQARVAKAAVDAATSTLDTYVHMLLDLIKCTRPLVQKVRDATLSRDEHTATGAVLKMMDTVEAYVAGEKAHAKQVTQAPGADGAQPVVQQAVPHGRDRQDGAPAGARGGQLSGKAEGADDPARVYANRHYIGGQLGQQLPVGAFVNVGGPWTPKKGEGFVKFAMDPARGEDHSVITEHDVTEDGRIILTDIQVLPKRR